jgi:predicted lipid-binding transport protein (Tim44 family)
MDETADFASTLPAIILLSFWWAFLSALEFLSRPPESGGADLPGATVAGDAPGPAREKRPLELSDVDPEFSAEAFLDGARRAYEAVLGYYARGEVGMLRPLLSPEVLQAFADACAGRAERGGTLDLTFIGIESAKIVSVEISADAVEITVDFRAQVASSERSADGTLIGGDPAAVMLTADLWTFSRPLPVESDAWVVVATDEADD